jgi:hypothetical protein
MKRQAQYHIEKETKDYVFIQDDYSDENMCPTVTNAAENVLKDLWDNHNLGHRKIYYQDTEGQIDELVHEGDKFKGFFFGYENAPELVEYRELSTAADYKMAKKCIIQ